MKLPQSKFGKFLKRMNLILGVLALLLLGGLYWLERPEKEEPLSAQEEAEIEEEMTPSEPAEEPTEEEIDAAAEEMENYVTDEQKQIYAAFHPQLDAFSNKYDSTWEELWMPAFDVAETNPEGAVNMLVTIASAYESYAEDLRALTFPAELDESDASDFDLATDRFADAMGERQKAVVFAAAAIRQGTLTDDSTIAFIKGASDRADSKLIDAAATFYDLNTKYGYTQ